MPSHTSHSAMRSGLDAQFSFVTEFARRSADAARQLSELNLHYAQLLIDDAVTSTRQVLTCADPLQVAGTLVASAQPAAEHWRSYLQQLGGMFTGIQRALTRQAEAALPEAARYGAALARNSLRDDVTGGDPLTNASRSDGAATSSTSVHHQYS